jgi:hypothetical protein
MREGFSIPAQSLNVGRGPAASTDEFRSLPDHVCEQETIVPRSASPQPQGSARRQMTWQKQL